MISSRSALISFVFVLVAGSVQPYLAAQVEVQEPLQRAERLLSEQKFQDARQVLEQLLSSTTEKAPPQAYYQLALCYVKQAEWKKAEETLQTFLRVSPESFPALYLKGLVLF